jgi:hypothetical protein
MLPGRSREQWCLGGLDGGDPWGPKPQGMTILIGNTMNKQMEWDSNRLWMAWEVSKESHGSLNQLVAGSGHPLVPCAILIAKIFTSAPQ